MPHLPTPADVCDRLVVEPVGAAVRVVRLVVVELGRAGIIVRCHGLKRFAFQHAAQMRREIMERFGWIEYTVNALFANCGVTELAREGESITPGCGTGEIRHESPTSHG